MISVRVCLSPSFFVIMIQIDLSTTTNSISQKSSSGVVLGMGERQLASSQCMGQILIGDYNSDYGQSI
jgi:hypothetical protein